MTPITFATETTKKGPRRTRRSQRSLLSVLRVLCGLTLCGLCGLTVSAQGKPDRSAPPPLGPAPQINLPQIQKRTLSNGLPVWLIEAHAVPLVQVSLLIKAGAADDPAGKFGTASLTAAMLDEGAGSRTALQISDEADFLGADLATTSSFDASAVRLNVPVSRMRNGLALMADVALRPTFPPDELERVRKERLTTLLQAKDDPADVVPIAFARTVFGATHRYGTPGMGTESTLKGFTVADLKAFHTAMYQPANATLIVIGDVRAADAIAQLEMHFGTWKNGAAPPARQPVPTAPQLTQGQITIVDIPGAAQSQIRIGWVGVPRSTPDYFTLEVLNTVLGGSFTSRLNQNLREEHQYSYGAGSRFDMRLSPGPFFATAGVQTDKTSEALTEFFKELNDIGKPIGAEELTKAKNYIALSFPGEFETLGDLAGHIEEMIVYSLPETYFATYVKNIQSVTSEAVQKAAATFIQPKRFAVVVVGDRKTIEPRIRALNLAPVRVVSVNEGIAQ
jgi:zinc protease